VYRPCSTHCPPPVRSLKLSVVVPFACTTLTGTAVLRFLDVDHQMYTSYVPAAARFGVHRYVSVPAPEQLYSESVPKKFAAGDVHQLPVNVRAASCTPAGALSITTSPAGGGGAAAAIVNVSPPDSPPPGLGVNTVTVAVPGSAGSDHPANVNPGAGCAVIVTGTPWK